MVKAVRTVRLFLSGDVMTGRGLDQILPHPGDPRIYEPVIHDARDYVRLAEAANGPIPRPVDVAYPWGEALDVLRRIAPNARVVNLETAVTARGAPWPKGINYRMHPANIGTLTAAALDVCVLANNHTLDYGPEGLLETLATLRAAGLRTAGAGRDLEEARRPAVVPLPGGGRLLVFAFAAASSGVPPQWAAAPGEPGVAFIPELTPQEAERIAGHVRGLKRDGDLVLLSLHWGSNWGYEIAAEQVRFAHRLIDAGVDLVHGHSSHHPRSIEIYRGRLVLYGCGDLLDDYEGISGYEEFRHDLRLMYFPALAGETGELTALTIVPLRIRRMRLERASEEDARWLAIRLTEISRPFGVRVETTGEGLLRAA
ncbi:MAG TPA: CapA family protein [bacterium]|nr:CapA family protein [bacterium]